MNEKMSTAQVEQFRADVLKAIAHGAAISGVLADVRSAGWTIRGSLYDFELLLEEAGFIMERVTKKGTHWIVKTFVRVPRGGFK